MSVRPYLNLEQVQELDQLFLEAYAFTTSLRARASLASHICAPRVPSPLTESIAALCVPRLFGEQALAFRPGDRHDLGVSVPRAPTRMAAVKGTGPSRWSTLTKTDLRADCLIWVDYADRAVSGSGPVHIWCFDRTVGKMAERVPGDLGPHAGRVSR